MPRCSPVELSNAETTDLLRSFVQGKREVLEEDCLTLLRWANETRLRQSVLSGMLAGALQPVVDGNAVKVQLAPAATGRIEGR